jgi:hypothetical protein
MHWRSSTPSILWQWLFIWKKNVTLPQAKSYPGSSRQCEPQRWASWSCQCSSASFPWWGWRKSAEWSAPRLARTHLSQAVKRLQHGDINTQWGVMMKEYKARHIFVTKIHEVRHITPKCITDFTIALTSMWNIQEMRMAQRIPSRHRAAMSWSSQSCRPTLNAARKGVQAICSNKQSSGYVWNADQSNCLAS